MAAAKGGKPNTTKGGKPTKTTTKPNPVTTQAEAIVDAALDDLVLQHNHADLIAHLAAGPVSVNVANLPSDLKVNATFSDPALASLGTISVGVNEVATKLGEIITRLDAEGQPSITTEAAIKHLMDAATSGEAVVIGDLPDGLSLIWDDKTGTATLKVTETEAEAEAGGFGAFISEHKVGIAVLMFLGVVTVGTVYFVRRRRAKKAAIKAANAVLDNGLGAGELYAVADDMSYSA